MFKDDRNVMNKYVKRLLSDTVILALGTFVSKLLVFLMLPLYTKYLSPDMYSYADLISQAANLIIPFACLGITNAVFRFVTEREGDKSAVLSSGFAVMIVGFALFLILSPLLGLFSKFEGFVWLIIFYTICADIHSLFAQYVRAKGRIKLFACQGIFNTSAVIILNIVFLVFLKLTVTGYILSVIVADALTTLFIIIVDHSVIDIKFSKIRKDLIFDMLKYCIPLIPTTIFWWITNVSDRYMVSVMCGDTENGLYAAAYKIPTLLTLASGIFNEAWQFFTFSNKKEKDVRANASESTDLMLEGEKKANSVYYGKTFAAFSTVMIIAASFIMAVSEPLTDILLADDYAASWIYIPLLLIATVFTALVTFLGSVYAYIKKTVMSLITATVGASTNIILNIVLIPRYGSHGAALATAASYIAAFTLMALSLYRKDVRKYVDFRTLTPCFILGITSIAAQCSVILYTGRYNFVIQAIFFFITVLVSMPVILSSLKLIFKKN